VVYRTDDATVAGFIASTGAVGQSGVSNTCNIGNVRGNNFVGGIIGETNGMVIATNCYNTADIRGISFIGGLIGRFNRNLNYYSSGIGASYNAGNVTGSGSFVGGIIGHNYAYVHRGSFFVNQINGIGLDSFDTASYNARNTVRVTADILKGYASNISNAFEPDSRLINNGFPILSRVYYGDYPLYSPDEAIAPVGEHRKYVGSLIHCEGDPIDVINGNFFWSYTDFELYGSNKLSFERTYNAQMTPTVI